MKKLSKHMFFISNTKLCLFLHPQCFYQEQSRVLRNVHKERSNQSNFTAVNFNITSAIIFNILIKIFSFFLVHCYESFGHNNSITSLYKLWKCVKWVDKINFFQNFPILLDLKKIFFFRVKLCVNSHMQLFNLNIMDVRI